MKAQVEALTPVRTKLTVEIPPERMQQEVQAHLDQYRRHAAIPGFRKGKAPESAVRRMFGDRAKADALSEIIRTSYGEALREHDVHPVNDADIEVDDDMSDGGLRFTATVEVRPTVVPTGYTGLSLKKERIVEDAGAAQARLEALREQHATFAPAEEGYQAANGDLVVIDFTGRIGDTPFEGGAATGHSLLLGSGRMIPGFEEGIVGAASGEERTIDVTFPAEYRAEELAGKAVQFDIKVHEVKRRALPELNDDFARQAADLETFDELKARIAEVVASEQQNRIEREFRAKMTDLLLEANPFEVPPSLVERQKEHSKQRMAEDLTRRGMDPAAMGFDTPEFDAHATQAAVRSVRWAFLLDAIATQEKVTVTEADVAERIREIAAADGRPESVIRAFFEREDHMDSLRRSLEEKKTIDAILATATVEEVDAEEWAAWAGVAP